MDRPRRCWPSPEMGLPKERTVLMTNLDRQIRSAQRRLWLNRWLKSSCIALAFAAGAFALLVFLQRSFALPIPLLLVGAMLIIATLAGSTLWSFITREDAALAAATLDEAAGLRERISSGHYCSDSSDPFARAVVADAERISGSLSAGQHIRLQPPRTLVTTTLCMIVAAMMFLVSPGWLRSSEATQAEHEDEAFHQTQVAVKRQLDRVRKIIETTPALEDLKDEFDEVDPRAGGALHRPDDFRLSAIKKIDNLADAIKQKQQSAKTGAMREMRKMLRRLDVPDPTDAPTRKITQALAQGDFQTAKEEIRKLQEQLATLKSQQDQAAVARISKDLAVLSKQIEMLTMKDALAKKLQKAGISKEDVERLLENLKKKDLDQIKKALQRRGLDPATAEKLAKQMKQQQGAESLAAKLAQALQLGAQAGAMGQIGEAIAGLEVAADQLSELELLEQEMAQLESAMAAMNSAQSGLSPCAGCNGLGMKGGKACASCGGSGMGQRRQGRGGLAREQQTTINFSIKRGKVHTGAGAIIGQFFVDGEQVRGEVTTGFSELVSSAEREASDRINRDRIPRQYQKAVKEYFSNVKRSVDKLRRGQNDSPSNPDAGGDTTTDD